MKIPGNATPFQKTDDLTKIADGETPSAKKAGKRSGENKIKIHFSRGT